VNLLVNSSDKGQRTQESNCAQHDEEEETNDSHPREIEACLNHARHPRSINVVEDGIGIDKEACRSAN
jgi:hypothetical protein